MTQTVRNMLNILKSKDYRRARRDVAFPIADAGRDPQDPMTIANLFSMMLREERPYILGADDAFGFHRTVRNVPIWKETQVALAEYGAFGNVTPNYARVIARGLDDLRDEVQKKHLETKQENRFLEAVLVCIDAMLELSDRYREEAKRQGNTHLFEALSVVPHKGAETYHQACLFQSLLLYSLRCANHPHTTLGRFDQYMYPYFQADLARGETLDSLLETTELYFIELNFDTDLYPGVQQGDNGQSLVLGGFAPDGTDQYNPLSRICMEASLELSLIDPKINLRCGKKTPQERLEFATKLTRQGLGFPQYCNDDVVVPCLLAWGYDPSDAYDYTVAACWEYIVPNCSADVPNRATMNFPLAINNAIHKHLLERESFAHLLEDAKREIRAFCDEITKQYQRESCYPAPLLSLLTDGCLACGKDLTEGVAKYNNYGCHGAGIANAADALAAVKVMVYDLGKVEKQTLLDALNADFEGYTELKNALLNCPKMGNNDDTADSIANELMDAFAGYLNGTPNMRGGIWRAGTGSAMEYIRSAEKCPATADGRQAYTPYSSSFSPALTTRLDGPVSMLTSFTKFDMRRISNGGPVTMELHDSVFRNKDGEKKVAYLVRYFIERGGHQLQLNAINRDVLLDAEAHPERYPNLIVRVWGWSGYFCELDPVYRKHVIARTEFTV